MQKYQCPDCIYAYDPRIGDPSQGVPPGTKFEDLPSNWKCPACRAGRRRFKAIH
ncbi:rubredoxin [Prochlorococcus sp. MIT 1341]|uniref:rubredoxin n=1 Tax=Prochlorococcus sp. MIT 1341 TaxID=3096221 RepID=UPI002A74ABF8|nr:rubredoxin [Prochlorococcus sp. MIT 1341]